MGLFSDDPRDLNVYGYKFRWGPQHHSLDELRKLRYTYDTVAAEACDALDEIVPPAPSAPRKNIEEVAEQKDKKKHRDLYRLIQEHAKTDPRVGKLWDEVNTVPEWVNWESIERGQKVFWRYGGPSMTGLAFLSLLGGMGNGNAVETLDRTGGFGATAVRRRLLETTQHTFDVHKDLESIKPGGVGWESSVRVRLLHTSVRRRIIQLAQTNPEYYNIKEFGVPINDLDCIGTMANFSSTLIWVGFPRQGILLRHQEKVDLLALWRYVAYLMGTPTDSFATPELAKAMMESLLVSEIEPSKKSPALANNIITGFEGQAPGYPSRGFLNASAEWLNGEQLSRELKLERPSLYHRSLVMGQCFFFMVMGYLSRNIPIWDEINISQTRKHLYEVFIYNKEQGALGYRTKYTFKWIPDLVHLTTPFGTPFPGQAEKSGAFRNSGLERTLLVLMITTGLTLGFTAWAGVRLVTNLGWADHASWGWERASAPVWALIRSVKA